MNQLIGVMTLLAVFPVLGQEPVESPKAPMRIGGTLTGSSITLKIDGKTVALYLVEIGQGQTIYVQTQQKLGNRAAEKFDKLTALNREHSEAILTALKEKKGKDLKKAMASIRKEFEEKKKAVVWVVVHGVTATPGPILEDKRAMLVTGEIHDANAKAKPAPPQPGFTAIEGEMQPGKVELGKEGSAPFSVKVDKVSIAIVGKQAMALSETKGFLRVLGTIRINGNGIAIIEADKLELLKK